MQRAVASLPQQCGVYAFVDRDGTPLYIGKANNIARRVRSYFEKRADSMRPAQDLSPAKRIMVTRAASVGCLVTDTETEALLLEAALIKRHQPPFNISLKDDKSFPYIVIDQSGAWGRIFVSRRREIREGEEWYGPYPSATAVKETFRLLKRAFPYCSRPPREGKPLRPCFQYQLGRCMGPCVGAVSREEYAEVIKNIALFLGGAYRPLLQRLEQEMNRFSQKEEFEKAARIRDRIQHVQRLMERQKVVLRQEGNRDYACIARLGKRAAFAVLQVREGRLVHAVTVPVRGAEGVPDSDSLFSSVMHYYGRTASRPKRLELSVPLGENQEQAIRDEYGIKEIHVPIRGTHRGLVQMGIENALLFLRREEKDDGGMYAAVRAVADALQLSSVPRRVEMYDISNIHGKHAIGSLVVWEDGALRKQEYRLFRIVFPASHDPAMIAEMLARRARRTWRMPGLVVIDGGKPQLSFAARALQEAGGAWKRVPVIALAKRHEEVFCPGRKAPVRISADSPALHFLQMMRDEAHRFAIQAYRRRHRKEVSRSFLRDIPGIGPVSERALLRAFGSGAAVQKASYHQLEQVVGAHRARLIVEHGMSLAGPDGRKGE